MDLLKKKLVSRVQQTSEERVVPFVEFDEEQTTCQENIFHRDVRVLNTDSNSESKHNLRNSMSTELHKYYEPLNFKS
jgi:hypothetical protein